MYLRTQTKQVVIGGVAVGGDAPVRVESMTKTPRDDVGATLAQLEGLAAAGCELCRVAVPDVAAAAAFRTLVAASPLPLMADIHFDYRLALACLDAGAAAIRWNPGNITKKEQVRSLAAEVAARGAVARVGVNAGSLPADVLRRYGRPTPEALAATALAAVRELEDAGVENIIVSAKSSSAAVNLRANQLIAAEVAYPLHVGVTEAGAADEGIVWSAVGIASVLTAGIGNTIRVSLTDDPKREVEVAYYILHAAGIRGRGPHVISCPTCGRTEIDVGSLVARVKEALRGERRPLTVAVMGCVVNGPGEAREADFGVAGGRGRGVVYRRGEAVRVVPEQELAAALLEELAAAQEGEGC